MTAEVTRIDIDEMRQYIQERCSDGTKIYLGVDSERYKVRGVWYADYLMAAVIHVNGSKGCKIYAEVQKERDFDQRKDRPFNRMMTEARKVCELYERLKDLLLEHDFEIHVDISPYEKCGSNVAYAAAVGYIKAMTMKDAVTKPSAWCASFAADRARELGVAVGYAQDGTGG